MWIGIAWACCKNESRKDSGPWKANQNLRVKRTRTRALGRTEWASVVRKAKVEITKL
jgi:hypothetical protein